MKQDFKRKTIAYITGFILSIIITLTAYLLVMQHVTSHHLEIAHKILISIIVITALLQLLTQSVFFLHLGQEKKPHWNLMIFIFTVLIIIIIVGGSLWIMQHLNYNMNPSDMDKYLIHDEGIRK